MFRVRHIALGTSLEALYYLLVLVTQGAIVAPCQERSVACTAAELVRMKACRPVVMGIVEFLLEMSSWMPSFVEEQQGHPSSLDRSVASYPPSEVMVGCDKGSEESNSHLEPSDHMLAARDKTVVPSALLVAHRLPAAESLRRVTFFAGELNAFPVQGDSAWPARSSVVPMPGHLAADSNLQLIAEHRSYTVVYQPRRPTVHELPRSVPAHGASMPGSGKMVSGLDQL